MFSVSGTIEQFHRPAAHRFSRLQNRSAHGLTTDVQSNSHGRQRLLLQQQQPLILGPALRRNVTRIFNFFE